MQLELFGQIFEKKKNIWISNFMKIRPVGTKLFHVDGQTEKQAGVTKQIAAFRNFVNAPINQ